MKDKIIQKLQLPEIVKMRYSKFPEITADQFVSAILNNKDAEDIAKELGIHKRTFFRLTKTLIPCKGNNTAPWRNYLAELIGEKGAFNVRNPKVYDPEKSKEYRKKYNENNRGKVRAANARRRAAKNKATPSWCELDKINEFYDNCPEGYHVDHIIPLQGEVVCGLHVLDNLQYLSAFDNLSKGNKYDIE